MDNRLRVTAGPDRGLSFELPETGLRNIGRVPVHNEIRLHDPSLCRVHCQVKVDQGRVVLSDLDSETGTFVNGARITRQELKHADVIRIGNTELCLEAIGEPKRPTQESAAPAPLSATGLSQLAGTRLGHYEMGPVVGRGRRGLVFRAHDTKQDHSVALKVLRRDFPRSEDELNRFIETMRAMVPLRHPNLVTIYSVGRAGPHCWVAMEYVRGESLAHMIQRIGAASPPGWQQAFRLATHGGRALHFAGQHQLAQGPVSPADVLFRTTDHLFKLSDRILTPALAGSHLQQAALAQTTDDDLPYLAPEQTHLGSHADGRSAIYNLGAMVYALLTGRPFAGQPAAPRQAQPDMPDAFEQVVLKMLATRPEDRHQTPAELLADLARVAPDPA
ncbi:MAG TPA: FHA domain-containing serine/threonine-protein kinase [Gemmataceae bacterium]|nr:FHA domain-containing serine/threonine-protein kinase [Gemmataceae bacterium]